jgi:hypothetical protein
MVGPFGWVGGWLEEAGRGSRDGMARRGREAERGEGQGRGGREQTWAGHIAAQLELGWRAGTGTGGVDRRDGGDRIGWDGPRLDVWLLVDFAQDEDVASDCVRAADGPW